MSARHTLIRGGWILTLDPQDHELPTGDLLVEDGIIRGVAAAIPPPEGAEVIDAAGMIVLPGLVDTHRHTWQSALRHRGAEWSLTTYLTQMLGTIGARYLPEDVHAGTLLGALSSLDAGVTTLVDWSHIQNSPEHSDAAVSALSQAGIRAVFAHGWSLNQSWQEQVTSPHPQDLRRIRVEVLPDDGALVTMAMAARGPDITTMDTTTADFALARELAIPITAHIAGGLPGPHQRGIERLDAAGLLGPDLTVVHANGASDDDLLRLAEHGTSVSISPQIELTMPELGSAVVLRRLLAAGIRPGLSVDSETAASGDLFTQMRFALAAHRSDTPDTEPTLPARQVLRHATIDGARTAGLADRTGSLEPGKAADVILLRATDLNLAPVSNPAEAVVLAAHPGNVDTVLVGGQIVKRHGHLLADVERARVSAIASAEHVLTATVHS